MSADSAVVERPREPVRPRAFRTILVVVSGTADDATTLTRALALAGDDVCRLKVLLAPQAEEPKDWISRLFGPTVAATRARNARYAAARRDLEFQLVAFARHHRLAYGDQEGGRSIGLAAERSTPWRAMRRELPLVDLVVVGGQAARRKDVWNDVLSDAVLAAQTPLYVVRHVGPHTRLPAAAVAVAWDASWAAGRALRNALPLLARTSQIVILQDRADLTPRERDAGRPKDLADYLRREGLTRARVTAVPVAHGGQALLDAARQTGSGVLVMGAFGRPRWIERLLGGVTRRLLDEDGAPDLFLTH